jgi:hypothetical protein
VFPPDDAAISITAVAASAIVMSTIATGIYLKQGAVRAVVKGT